ncbi:glutathione S-transferase family protein [Paraburkholderia xenovorans]|uniref:glutathione S-transferase family protein n=1 Tax=Paraburkholderia xenovorans TaxID=36873 RepID=UPI0038BB6FD7
MNQITLYHFPMSICSMKVRLCLAELAVPYDERIVDIGLALENLEPWYVRLNPRGVVPTLCDGELVVTDSAKIMYYLADRFETGLPQEPQQRAEVGRWVDVADTFPLHAISYSRCGIPRGNELLASRLARIVENKARHPDLADTYSALYDRVSALRDASVDGEGTTAALAELDTAFSNLNAILASNPFIGSETYSIADVIWTVTLARLDMLKLGDLFSSFPLLSAYYERMVARPSFDAARICRAWVGAI